MSKVTARIQKRRQDLLGLGWANHDHHTFRSSRAHFADFPRTELTFDGPAPAAAPALVVYYAGVPDTTPEFAAADRLYDEHLDQLRREGLIDGQEVL